MKQLALFIIVCFTIGCASSTKYASGELNGDWVPIQQQIGDVQVPKAAMAKQQLTLMYNKYTTVAESIDKGEVRYANGKMDIYGKDGINAGKHFTAIYKLGNGQLIICYNLLGDSYPESFDTQGKKTLFISVFKKK